MANDQPLDFEDTDVARLTAVYLTVAALVQEYRRQAIAANERCVALNARIIAGLERGDDVTDLVMESRQVCRDANRFAAVAEEIDAVLSGLKARVDQLHWAFTCALDIIQHPERLN